MITTTSNRITTLDNEKLVLEFNEDHILRAIRANDIMISQFETPCGEMAISNIYLRAYKGAQLVVTPLLFSNSSIETFHQKGSVSWKTETEQFIATVTVSLASAESVYFYTVDIESKLEAPFSYDLVYGQDLSLADAGAVKTNEAYCSQYLDHQIFDTEQAGYTVCSRQNLPMSTGNPSIQIGCFDKIVGYSTDGYQFFGNSFKVDGEIAVLMKPSLANKRYQYEMAYVALQTEKHTLEQESKHSTVFYGAFHENSEGANVTEPKALSVLETAYQVTEIKVEDEFSPVEYKKHQTLIGLAMNSEEVEQWFAASTGRKFVEEDNGTLLSFFYDDYKYVTLQEKERLTERPTGHVISSGNNQDRHAAIMSSSHYMFGVFNSQLTLGNTSFNKLLGVNRNSLNQFKHTGQRIWVKQNDQYSVLDMPSAYETGLNYSRWIYKLETGFIEVVSTSAAETPVIQTNIKLHGISSLDVSVSHQLIFGNNEDDSHITVERDDNQFTVTGVDDNIKAHTPELTFSISADAVISEAEIIKHSETGSAQFLVLKGTITDSASIHFGGRLGQEDSTNTVIDATLETDMYAKRQSDLVNNFDISCSNSEESADKLQAMMTWFTHNALVHYSTPHGLEQYSGAAWGTRDVSQGPFEFFMSMGQYDKARDLLECIYSHQFFETGTWPQWFMFDQYSDIQQEESHGDIIVWPLKALAEYINTTNDVDILNTELPFTYIENGFSFGSETYSLFEHVARQIQHIQDNLVPGTSLSCYGDGDWDDTLQPANQSLRENMVSGWTIPLTLQAVKSMKAALESQDNYTGFCAELNDLYTDMEADFRKYLIKDDIISGFIHFSRDETGEVEDIEYLLHPSDEKTGINFRLLPASRSIISETFSLEMANEHMAKIQEELVYPDGVRLMNQMAEYKAGKQTYFKRAELAANLGREVGLQYCHAHIRFIEALCKMGKADDVFENLFKIVPMGIQSSVPNAELRQSNAYFSSSDGQFNDRYEAYQGMDKLKQGEVKVKGGWRIYSSGPGIYINQVISNVLGIRFENQSLVLDPVLSKKLGKTEIDFKLMGHATRIIIDPVQGVHTPKSISINGTNVDITETKNRYRTGGALIDSKVLMPLLNEEGNTIHITL